MAKTPFYLRSFLSGLAGGLVLAAAVWVVRWHPDHPPPFISYAQYGEDVILRQIFDRLVGIPKPTYIDIGAHDPIVNNNSYLFYRGGSHGVLVEPNPDFTDLLKKTRPRDVVLDVGIGASAADELVDYYVMWDGKGQLNTFSPEVAKERHVRKVIKRKLVNVNKILGEYFPKGGPDLFSTDTEGYDLTILKTLDFDRFRPRVICVETMNDTGELERPIIDLLESKGYEIRGGTWVNTIFVDRRYLYKKYGWASEAPASSASPAPSASFAPAASSSAAP
jgi:hypothetical protein